jgi:hypothetical protein
MGVLFIHSHYSIDELLFQRHAEAGRVRLVRERDLDTSHFAAASGLITTQHLDQVGLMQHAGSLHALLARGGRWIFNGHMARVLVPGLSTYVPLRNPRRADFVLIRLADHPIFDGIDQKALEEDRGVAGFYGRGHNPIPQGAVAINGVGPHHAPVDWMWALPGGGQILSHAGSDFWNSGDDEALKQVLADRALAWVSGDLGR